MNKFFIFVFVSVKMHCHQKPVAPDYDLSQTGLVPNKKSRLKPDLRRLKKA